MSTPLPPHMTDDSKPEPESQLPRMFGGFATIVAINLALIAGLSLVPHYGWLAFFVGLAQFGYVIPIAVWRFWVKDTAFGSGVLIGAAISMLLSVGAGALYGLISLCGGIH